MKCCQATLNQHRSASKCLIRNSGLWLIRSALQRGQSSPLPLFTIKSPPRHFFGLRAFIDPHHPSAFKIDMAVESVMIPLGSPAPDFNLRIANPNVDAREGDVRSFHDYADAKLLVVVFTCNHCPYAMHIEDRLIALARDLAPRGVEFVAINPNSLPPEYPIRKFPDACAFLKSETDRPMSGPCFTYSFHLMLHPMDGICSSGAGFPARRLSRASFSSVVVCGRFGVPSSMRPR